MGFRSKLILNKRSTLFAPLILLPIFKDVTVSRAAEDHFLYADTGLILSLRPANERRCYFVMAQA